MNRRYLCVTPLALALSALTYAQSASIQPTQDGSLYLSGSGGTANGSGEYLFSGTTGGAEARRALLQFDVAGAVPAGSTITSATLTLQLNKTGGGNLQLRLHRLTQSWGEGASDAMGQEGGGTTSQPGDATWVHTFFPSSFWNNVGGDFLSSASATTTVPFSNGAKIWSSAQLTADVQHMLDNAGSNFGWTLLPPDPEQGNAKRFGSREHQTQQPVLTITYTAGPSAGVTSVGTGCVGSSGQAYTITNSGLPQLGNTSFAIPASGGPAGGPTFLFFASGTGGGLPIISPSCLTYLDLTSALAFASSGVSPIVNTTLGAAGSGSFGLPVPNNSNLLGLPFAVEAVAVDFGIPSLLVSSNALDLTFGV